MSILKFVNRVFKAQGQNVSALIPFKFEARKNILTEKYCTCCAILSGLSFIYLFIYLFVLYASTSYIRLNLSYRKRFYLTISILRGRAGYEVTNN